MLFATVSTISFVQMGFIWLGPVSVITFASLTALFAGISSLRAGVMVVRIHSNPKDEANRDCN